MKKLMVGLIFIIYLAGCSSELTFKEINMDRVDKDIQDFINIVQDENGAHLYHDNKQNMYIFLNGSNVVQGSKAMHFNDFNLEANGDTLKILFHHDYT